MACLWTPAEGEKRRAPIRGFIADRRGRWGRRFWLLLSLLTKVTRPSGRNKSQDSREPASLSAATTPPLNPLPQGEGKNSKAPTPTLPRFAGEGDHQKHPSPPDYNLGGRL